MTEYTDLTYQQAREIVHEAKEQALAIRLDRIGATPWLFYTPYTNNRGVAVHMWSCISYTFRKMPEKTLLTHPTVIKPEDYDDWEIRMLTDEWLVNQVHRSRIVKTKPLEDSPFDGGIVGGWNE
jgi:hypothetical protein